MFVYRRLRRLHHVSLLGRRAQALPIMYFYKLLARILFRIHLVISYEKTSFSLSSSNLFYIHIIVYNIKTFICFYAIKC